jgi:CBS domain-containing protein
MRKVSHILQRKGKTVVSVEPDLPVLKALELMAEKNFGSLMIMKNDEYLGIMTERDYARKVVLKGKSSTETFVKDIMSTGLPRITPDNSIETCMHIMSESNIRYLPVFENDKVCGIISITDVVTETIISQKETIEQLKNYIQS